MAGQKFSKKCEICGINIHMVHTHEGWIAFDNFGKHYCSFPNQKEWSLNTLNHPFTCKTTCWWCGYDEVFYHTNGNGDSVLLEEPFGIPWIVHSCWENNKEDRTNRLNLFEKRLRNLGYNGEDTNFNERFFPKTKINLELIAEDYRVLDKAIQKICDFLSKLQIHYIGPLPYKKNNQFIRKLQFDESVFNHISFELQKIDLPPSISIIIKGKK